MLARTTVRACADAAGYELCCPRAYEAQVIEYLFIGSMAVDFEPVARPIVGNLTST